MRAFLTVQEGPGQGEIVTAEQGTMFRVGRQANADLTIESDRAMSGLHFAILCDKSRCRIRDLNSTNGTFVNGIRVNLVELHDRDTIRAGNSEFQVRFEGEINTTIVDPLMYPEIQRLRAKDTGKKGDQQRKLFTPSASPVLPNSLESTEQFPQKLEELAKSISAEMEGAVVETPESKQQTESTPQESKCDSSTSRIIRLNVVFNDESGKRQIWLSPGQTVIVGRNQMADVTVVGDASISGVHFGLDCEEKRCRLRDLQSQNGTRLNDVSVPYATIYTGDKFVAGKTEFEVTVEGGLEAPDAPLRTWVFEDIVRRKFATFYAKPIGNEFQLVDAVGIEPMPIEFLRRLARHRDVGILLDASLEDISGWKSEAQRSFDCGTSNAHVFHIPDIEKVVDAVREIWGKDLMAVLFMQEGNENALSSLPEAIAKYCDSAPNEEGRFGKANDWVKWVCDHPDRIREMLPNVEAVLVQHTDPKRWRLLCETNFITRLNRLGYLPSQPSVFQQEGEVDA